MRSTSIEKRRYLTEAQYRLFFQLRRIDPAKTLVEEIL